MKKESNEGDQRRQTCRDDADWNESLAPTQILWLTNCEGMHFVSWWERDRWQEAIEEGGEHWEGIGLLLPERIQNLKMISRLLVLDINHMGGKHKWHPQKKLVSKAYQILGRAILVTDNVLDVVSASSLTVFPAIESNRCDWFDETCEAERASLMSPNIFQRESKWPRKQDWNNGSVNSRCIITP